MCWMWEHTNIIIRLYSQVESVEKTHKTIKNREASSILFFVHLNICKTNDQARADLFIIIITHY